jgi:hypothetical protein
MFISATGVRSKRDRPGFLQFWQRMVVWGRASLTRMHGEGRFRISNVAQVAHQERAEHIKGMEHEHVALARGHLCFDSVWR